VVGRLLRHRRASPSAALDKAIRLIIDSQASAQSQPPDHPVSRLIGDRDRSMSRSIVSFAILLRTLFPCGISSAML
jgi:hypothetical protein